MLNVSSCKLVVTLHGVVASEEDLRLAADLARGVSEAAGVIDRLTVNEQTASGK